MSLLSANKLFYTNTDYNDASNALINYNNLTGNSESLEHPLSKYARGLFFSPNYNKEFFDAINWANNLGQYNNQNNPLLSNILINTFQEPPSNYSDISGLVAVYLQGDWDIVNNVWYDRSSNSTVYNAVLSATVGFQATSLLGNGSPINVTALKGGPTNSISFGNVLSNNYTVCSIARKTETSPDPSPYADHVYFGVAATATSVNDWWALYTLRVVQSEVDIMRLSPDPVGGYPRNQGLLGDSLGGAAYGGGVGFHSGSWGYQIQIADTTGTEPAFFMKKDMSLESAFDGTQLTIELIDYNHNHTPESGNFLSSATGEPGSWVVRGSWSNNPWPPNAVSSVPHGSNTGRIYNQILSGYTPPPPPIPPIISDGVSWAHGSGGGDLLINGAAPTPPQIPQIPFYALPSPIIAETNQGRRADLWMVVDPYDEANDTRWNGCTTTKDWSMVVTTDGRAKLVMSWYVSGIPGRVEINDNYGWNDGAPGHIYLYWTNGTGTLSIGVKSPNVGSTPYDGNFSFAITFDSALYQNAGGVSSLTSITLGEQKDSSPIKMYTKSDNVARGFTGNWERQELVNYSFNGLDPSVFFNDKMMTPTYSTSYYGHAYGSDSRIEQFDLYDDVWVPPPTTPVEITPDIPETNWVVTCETGETNDSALYVNSDDHSGSNFEIVELAVWDRKLTGDELQSVSNYMMYNVLGIRQPAYLMIETYALQREFQGEEPNDQSGWAVAMSADGTILAIGAGLSDGPGNTESNTGSVRVYYRTGDVWAPMGQVIHGEWAEDYSGTALAMSADGLTLAVGARYNNNAVGTNGGHVRVWEFNSINNAWVLSSQDLDAEYSSDRFGWSVALSADGTIVAAGGPQRTEVRYSGHGPTTTRVWRRPMGAHAPLTPHTWNRMGTNLDEEAEGDNSGYSMALSADGMVLAVGAIYNVGGGTSNGNGHVRVWRWDAELGAAGDWAHPDADIDGTETNYGTGHGYLGASVTLSADGTTLAAGATYNGGSVQDSRVGHVGVYRHNPGADRWDSIGDIYGDDAAVYEGEMLGTSVALSTDGEIIAMGSGGSDVNRLHVYALDGNSAYKKLFVSSISDSTGAPSHVSKPIAVAMSADGLTVAAGMYFGDTPTRVGSGMTSVYTAIPYAP